MFPSERFLARISKYRKTSRTEPLEAQVSMIRNAFLEMNRHLPAALVGDVLDHFVGDLAETPGATPFDRTERLGDVMDVLHEQYDEETDPLDRESWTAIAEAVSDLAMELDMEFVNYVMRLAVDHHAV